MEIKELNEFPKTMERLLSEQQSAEIMNANISSREFQKQAQVQIDEQRAKMDKKSDSAVGWGAGLGIVIGLLAGVFVCSGVFSNYEDWNGIIFGILAGGATWIACCVLMLAGGVFIGNVFGSNNAKKIKKVNQSINEADIMRGQQADTIRHKYDTIKNNYRQQFMEQAMIRKERFAKSEVGEEIYQWLFSGICDSIEMADRGEQAGQVDISFSIGILSRAVKSDFGMYDFAQHQVAELVPLDQTALAYVFYERLQSELKFKYPADISGTPADIRGEVELTENVVNIWITYRAVNGYHPK